MQRNKIVLFIILLSLLILLRFAYLDFENSVGTRTYPLVSVIILFFVTLLFSNKILYWGIDSKILEPTSTSEPISNSPDLLFSILSIFGGLSVGLVIGIFLLFLIATIAPPEFGQISFIIPIITSIIGAFVGPLLFKDFLKKILYK